MLRVHEPGLSGALGKPLVTALPGPARADELWVDSRPLSTFPVCTAATVTTLVRKKQEHKSQHARGYMKHDTRAQKSYLAL